MRRKNLFSIGRREGDENQLTEMLAYLLQEERGLTGQLLIALGLPADPHAPWQVETQRAIPNGFLDLVAFVPGQALVILESKLGSFTDFAQMAKYIDYAAAQPVAGLRALVFTTQHPEAWPAGIAEHARSHGVLLFEPRWQAVADALSRSEQTLPIDFVAMLAEEGLVHPAALTTENWQAWREGHKIARILSSLIAEADHDLQAVLPGFTKRGPVVFSSNGQMYRSYEFAGVQLWVGFWPSRNPANPADHALVTVFAARMDIPVTARKELGRKVVARAGLPGFSLSDWSEAPVLRTCSTHEVLIAESFLGQRDQLVGQVRDVLAFLREIEYL